LRRFGDTLNDENEVFSDHCSNGSEFTDFVPNDFTICVILGEINSLLEHSESDVDIFNSNSAHGGCDLSTEDAYSSYTPNPMQYLQRSDLYCGLFHLPDLDSDLDCKFSLYLTGHSDLIECIFPLS
jgi:hypothetical protein